MYKKGKNNVFVPSIEQVEEHRKHLIHKKTYLKVLQRIVSVLLVVAVIAVLASTLILPVVQVSGSSMKPTLEDGDILILIKSKNYSRGELCCISWQNKILLKRIIGLPGDYISIDNEGNVYVNNELLDENYVSGKSL